MKNKKTYVCNILFMVLILAVTFYVLLKGQDMRKITAALRRAQPGYVLLAAVCAVVFLLLQAYSLQIIMASLGSSIRYRRGAAYTFICFLFNAITPSASGGQPVQVYYMHEDGISLGDSSIALLFWTILYKVALVCLEGVVLLFCRSFLFRSLGGYLWLFWLGLGVNLVSILLYSIIVFSQDGARNITYAVTWVCHKLRIIRRKEKVLEKLDHSLEIYNKGARYFRTHLELAAIVLLITILQRLCYFAITWFACLALGLTDVQAGQIILLQSFVAVCIDILPLPGGVGVNESFFVTIFQKVIGRQNAFSTMFLSRGASFYVLLVVSVFVTIGTHMRILHRKQHAERNEE